MSEKESARDRDIVGETKREKKKGGGERDID